MDGMRPRYRVGQAALVSHVIVFMGRLVVAIAKDRERAFGLGRRQLGLFGRLRQSRMGWRRKTGLRDRIEVGFFFERAGAT